MQGVVDLLANAYWWTKSNDLPNWFVVIFTVILWPLALVWWNRRRVNHIPNLMVSCAKSVVNIGSTPQDFVSRPALDIIFFNNTGSVVYLNRPRLRNCSTLFPIPTDVTSDIAENAYSLAFINPQGSYADRQVTVQTGNQARTGIALNSEMPDSFSRYRVSRLRRLTRRPRYFVLEYTAMVGEKRYSVATIY
jgi:hypothetical protein